MMEVLEPFMNTRVYKFKRYLHFDNKVHWKTVRRKIEDPEFIKTHSFYPFIHYDQVFKKFPKKYVSGLIDQRDEPKTRSIMYSAHIDRYIYEYYAYLINERYNQYTKIHGTSRCSLAYRTNKRGQNNITYAKSVFEKIKSIGNAFIIVGDFTGYFDHIDHAYLKTMLCKLMGFDRLPDDYYAVFRGITKYSFVDLDDIRKYKGLDYKQFKLLSSEIERYFEPKEFREFKKDHIKTNKNGYGIPQGSAISAAFSNVYLLEFDQKLNDYIASQGGIYRRYCDDFIIVLPWENSVTEQHISKVNEIVNTIPKLDLQPDKTQTFHYKDSEIQSISDDGSANVSKGRKCLSYLGFTFDGKSVTIRSKTISKFYERMYRKIDHLTEQEKEKGVKISRRKLYKMYSYKGSETNKTCRKQGNFLSYVKRAEKVFGPDEAVNRDTKKAWKKMQKRLRKNSVAIDEKPD